MSNFIQICSIDDILPNTGRAALVNGKQVAVFHVKTVAKGSQFFAIDNFCPFSRANVLARGIVGSLQKKTVIASPIYKQHFDLKTGQCLEDESVCLETWKVTLADRQVLIESNEQAAA